MNQIHTDLSFTLPDCSPDDPRLQAIVELVMLIWPGVAAISEIPTDDDYVRAGFVTPEMDDTIHAPWTQAQVAALNDFQREGIMHPFTCREHSSIALTATEPGWVCTVDGCGYSQTWAHSIMADPDWLAEAVERRKGMFGRTSWDTTRSYHDLYVTTSTIERIRLFDMPFGYEVTCNRVGGWSLVRGGDVLASEYGADWLVLDVAGYVIVDGRDSVGESDGS